MPREAVMLECPRCHTARRVNYYRAQSAPQTLCRACAAEASGQARRGWKQSAEMVARRVETARANGSTERNIARLAVLNRGRRASPEHRAAISEANRRRERTSEFRAKIGAAARERWRLGKQSSRVGTGVRGRRADLGEAAFRSTWEANVARVLSRCGVAWEFEPTRFALDNGRSYCPDFRLATGVYLEVKGYLRPDAAERMRLFRSMYPDIVIDEPDDHVQFNAGPVDADDPGFYGK